METFIEYQLSFKNSLSANENIVFKHFSEPFIKKVTLFKGEKSNSPQRRMRIDLKEEKITAETLENIKTFVLEFLYKLALAMDSLFPCYEEIRSQVNIHDSLIITDKLIRYDKIPENNNIFNEDINFKKYLNEYKKMFEIVNTANLDSTTTFLMLYDWFSYLVCRNGENIQANVINYIKIHQKQLEKYICTKFIFTTNEKKERDEDNLTKLRNDIAHAYERINIEEIPDLKQQANYSLKLLISLIVYFFKNN